MKKFAKGRKGGLSTLKKFGIAHFSKIGKLGYQAMLRRQREQLSL